LARATVVHIIHRAGQAPCLRAPLSSNVRPTRATRWAGVASRGHGPRRHGFDIGSLPLRFGRTVVRLPVARLLTRRAKRSRQCRRLQASRCPSPSRPR